MVQIKQLKKKVKKSKHLDAKQILEKEILKKMDTIGEISMESSVEKEKDELEDLANMGMMAGGISDVNLFKPLDPERI